MFDVIAGPLVKASLRRLVQHGQLTVQRPNGETYQCPAQATLPGPKATVIFHTPSAERRLLTDPATALGELYMDGHIEVAGGTIYDLLALAMINLNYGGGSPVDTALRHLRRPWRRLRQINPAWRARNNVAHHYDLDGRLYSLFLDKDRFYSCAYFPTGRETLEEAQAAKVRHIAAKLHLHRPGLEILDIGSGWGGLAIALARDYGARVTGITLSTEQLALSRQRAEAAGVADRVRFELMDYRDWHTPVDRVVSVGMFEHVGIVHYNAFFRTVNDALRPDGIALIHAIGRAHGPGITNPWLAKYIFPGGYSPALSEVVPLAERLHMWITDVEILRLHYAETLRHWRRRFAANRDTIASIYDDRFCRMFEFYLAASEVTFRHADHVVWQMQLTRAVNALPITRDYITEAEQVSTRVDA
jgi:cyclopropane-fatty-acyl-phospholipid synthase